MARYTDGLTDKQAAFVREYVVDHNGTQAAIRAGYAESGAHSEAHRLLRKAEIADAVAELESNLADEIGITKQYILDRLRTVAEKALEGVPKTDKDGNPVMVDGVQVIEWNPAGVNKALELLGKHRGMFIERATVDHSGRIDITINGINPTDLT